jgi:hypothetical protein
LAKFDADGFRVMLSVFRDGNGPQRRVDTFMGILFRISRLPAGEVGSGKPGKIPAKPEKPDPKGPCGAWGKEWGRKGPPGAEEKESDRSGPSARAGAVEWSHARSPPE